MTSVAYVSVPVECEECGEDLDGEVGCAYCGHCHACGGGI